MKYRIDDNWWVESDSSSYNLHYEKEGDINPNTGKPMVARDVTYHARLKDALKYYLNETMKESSDVRELIARIENAEQKIEALKL